MSYCYLDELMSGAKQRYLEKLEVIKLKECPHRLPEGSWSGEMSGWPSVEYPDIYEYLINTPGNLLIFFLFYDRNLFLFLQILDFFRPDRYQ